MLREIQIGIHSTSGVRGFLNYVKRFHALAFMGCALFLFSPVSAKDLAKLSSIYFNSDHSFVVEFDSRTEVQSPILEKLDDDSYLVTLLDAKLNRGINKSISNTKFAIDLETHKSKDRAFFRSKDQVLIKLKALDAGIGELSPNTILEGLAYEFSADSVITSASSSVIVSAPSSVIASPKGEAIQPGLQSDSETIQPSLINDDQIPIQTFNGPKVQHQLKADLSENKIYTIGKTKTATEEFVAELDPQFQAELEQDIEFQEDTFKKVDSASLANIANELEEQGHDDQALKAYRRALSLNPDNSQARLGLAALTKDEEEKLSNYLYTVDDKALLAIGQQWFQQGKRENNSKLIAQSFISYQFAILKDPKNPALRLDYAQSLESAGGDFYSEAARRYLEAAALAKPLYLDGQVDEELLREATESLIRILVMNGDCESAIKYCNSYLGLGFSKFRDGKPILVVIREVEARRNPFDLGDKYEV